MPIKSIWYPERTGATAIELAVVAPVFFMLIFGIVEAGRAVMLKQAVTDAARAGTRTAILATTQSSDNAESAARVHLASAVSQTGDCVVTVTPDNLTEVGKGTEITTRVEVNLCDVSWILPDYLGEIMLTGETTMARE